MWKPFGWFRRTQLWATGDWQFCHHNAPVLEEFLANTKSLRWLHAPYSPYLNPCDFWLFPKLKSPLKRKRFQTISEIQDNAMGSWWWLGELCEDPRCLLGKWLRHHCAMYNVSCTSFNTCLFFLVHGCIPFRQTS